MMINRQTEERCSEYLLEMRECFLIEREEAMSRLSAIAELQESWQAAISQEAQLEIVRLRVELGKSRRLESQREREVIYLQRQLTEAAKQLAQYVIESEASDRIAE
jgi:hypothetical protein